MKKLRFIRIAVSFLLWLPVTLYAQSAKDTLISHPWFKIKKINEHILRIADGEIDNIYLIEGKDSALLIDTGIGAANLRDFIKSITSLPVIVVNTHSHPDHSGSNYQFSTVHAHPDDFDMIRFFGTPTMRKNMVKNMMRNPLPDSL